MEFRVEIASPTDADSKWFEREYGTYEDSIKGQEQAYIGLALTLLHGCLRTRNPHGLSVFQSLEDYKHHLMKRWTSYADCWQDIFADYESSAVFTPSDVTLASIAGRLLVHTQKLTLSFDYVRNKSLKAQYILRPAPIDKIYLYGYGKCLIRSTAGRTMGEFHFDQHVARRSTSSAGGSAEFISLSASTKEPLIWYNFTLDHRFPWSNSLYGCPCQTMAPTNTAQIHAVDFEHIEECCNRPEFLKPLPHQRDVENTCQHHWDNETLAMAAVSKHLNAVSYFDTRGKLLHSWNHVPQLHVILIMPSAGQGTEPRVYRRMGLCTVYLKRRVEEKPTFETVILE